MKLNTAFFATALMVTIPSTTPAEEKPYRRNLLLHYAFDQFDGETVPNALGKHHPGKPKRATFVKLRNSGIALQVRKNNLKSGYVETADHQDFNTRNFTVAAWIKLRKTKSNGSVVCKHDWHAGGARGFVLRCYNGKQLNFTVGARGWLAANGKTTLPPHRWVHVAGSFDGKTITVYFNGRSDGTKTITKPYTPSSYPLRIGHAAFALDRHRKFDGKIDDVMIWNRTLSKSEIRAVYKDQNDSRPKPLVAADIAGLVEQLGSDKYLRREAAQRQLIKIGGEVAILLDKFTNTYDLEVIERIKQIKLAINTGE